MDGRRVDKVLASRLVHLSSETRTLCGVVRSLLSQRDRAEAVARIVGHSSP